jgi:DNA polymerase-3 subunit alpha
VDLSAVNRATLEALVCAGAFDDTGAMRKALFEALDRAITWGQAAQSDRRSGQMALFGSEEGGAASACQEPALSTDEWSEAEMLAREKAALGFYITRHPLASDERLLETCTTASTVDLARYQDGDVVILGGMISSLRTVTARGGRNAGKKLGIVTLEDLKGRVEAILFPAGLVEYRAMLVPDAVVFVEGAVDRKREEPSLRVSRVVLADKAVETFATALLLDIPRDAPIEELIELLRASQNAGVTGRGECRVYLNVETADGLIGQIECNPAIRVTCEPNFLAALVELLGRDAVCVLGPNRRAIPFQAAGTPGQLDSRATERATVPIL